MVKKSVKLEFCIFFTTSSKQSCLLNEPKRASILHAIGSSISSMSTGWTELNRSININIIINFVQVSCLVSSAKTMGFSTGRVWVTGFQGVMGYGMQFPAYQMGGSKMLWDKRGGYGLSEV